jgi:hypothetical protein
VHRDPVVLSYLAGIVDADGYITINRSQRGASIYHAPQVGIAGTRREPHDLAASIWGGKVGCYAPAKAGYLPQFQWSRQGSTAAAAISELLPFLRVKIEQAHLALELWDHKGIGQSEDPFPWFGPEYDPNDARDEMRRDMIGLNISRSRLRRAGRLLDGIEHNALPFSITA